MVAKAAESGALDARLDTGGTDEIERMAEQFNRSQEAEAELRIAAIAFESNEGMRACPNFCVNGADFS